MSDTFQIKLAVFEGPFDLLLFFIERDELNIYDIPIAKITDEFLGYIHEFDSMNIELASEFILVAATLMRIKAKMLIPRRELDEKGEEIDPREELVNRLIEYKKYKEITETMRGLEEWRMTMASRGNIKSELKIISDSYSTETDLESLNLFKLLKTFNRVLEKFERESSKPVHQIVSYPYTITSIKDYLINRITGDSKISFEEIFENCENRVHAIYTFLSLLELIQEQFLSIVFGENFNQFWIMKSNVQS